jgi:hypothetical protein
MSQEELRMKRRALNHIRLDLAKRGIFADPYLKIEEEDLVADIRALERELGMEQTPTIQERRATGQREPRYQAPTPEPAFQERVAGDRLRARQAEIVHQLNLLKIHRSNMAHYRAQARLYGGIDAAPAITRNSMAEQRGEIARIKASLRQLGADVDDLPGDE